jgi:hypothetical protein
MTGLMQEYWLVVLRLMAGSFRCGSFATDGGNSSMEVR